MTRSHDSLSIIYAFTGLYKRNERLGPGVLTYPSEDAPAPTQDVGMWQVSDARSRGRERDGSTFSRIGSTETRVFSILG